MVKSTKGRMDWLCLVDQETLSMRAGAGEVRISLVLVLRTDRFRAVDVFSGAGDASYGRLAPPRAQPCSDGTS